jgi:hypothetical protein
VPPASPPPLSGPRRRAWLLAGALVATFAVLRAALHLRPNADFNAFGYNIHHLYTGLLVVTACAVPLAVGGVGGRARDLLVAGLGVGLGLALDEWVYLIVTDGSNAAYLLPASFWGGAALVLLAATYAAGAAAWAGRRRDGPDAR